MFCYSLVPSLILFIILNMYVHVHFIYEPVREKTNNLGSDKVRHRPGCTVTEVGLRLEI